MSTTTLLIVIAGMAAVTYACRAVPLFLAGRVTIPRNTLRWMRFIPPAVLAALIAPAVLNPHGRALEFGATNPLLLAALPTVLVAWKTKNMYATVLVGCACVALLRLAGL
ncbi:AzlD domain-containing protein [Streptomyces sp. H27-H1]|uniref:AzlD domain-containing protein n=1 Tax=Streptomyces sp. H27-H1 TaxID=2996461 RepID=UPI0022708B0A|nr:AzlD domain-containing protein [Streptomyces sp. H27-H1]MCY0929404.1 AzlD domain-containing protein [Streptomyces sp. H27-H1]